MKTKPRRATRALPGLLTLLPEYMAPGSLTEELGSRAFIRADASVRDESERGAMCVARLLSSEPFRRGRQGANATNATLTAEGVASRPLAHKAGEHEHAGGAVPRRKAEAAPPHGSGNRENQNHERCAQQSA